MSLFSPTEPNSSFQRNGIGMRRILPWVIAIHVLFLLGPLALSFISQFFSPPKENAFKVKLGADEPSHAPEVGMPERKRPSPEPPAPEPEPAPEPPAPEPPAPEPPAPKQEPAPEPPAPKPQPKPQPKPKPKPKAKPKPKKQEKPKKQPVKKTAPKKTVQKPVQPKRTGRPKNVEEAQKQVFQGGGSNFNPNVPIGTRDRGQAFGKQDNKTPMGGQDQAMQAYLEGVGKYLKTRWAEPSKAFIGDTHPQVLIEISIGADGRVLSWKILKPSGNHQMDDSVKRMLEHLDRVPAPSKGAVTGEFIMQVED